VLQEDGLAVGAVDRGGHHVAQVEFDLGAGMVLAAVFDDIVVEAAGLGRERAKRGEDIAAVDVGIMGEGTDAMGRVEIAVAVDGMFRAPAGFGEGFLAELAADAAVVLAVVEFYSPEVMLIAALEMDDLAEQPLLYHVEHGEDVAAVADIFQHHHMGIVFLGGFDDVPMVLEGDAEDHFRGDVFKAGFEGTDHHGFVPFPWGRDDDAVEGFFFQQVLPGIGAARIDLGHFLAGLADRFFGSGQHIVVDVTDGDEIDVVATEQETEVSLAAQTGTDDGHADFGACRSGFGPGRTLLAGWCGGPGVGGSGLRDGAGGGQPKGGKGAGAEEVLSIHEAFVLIKLRVSRGDLEMQTFVLNHLPQSSLRVRYWHFVVCIAAQQPAGFFLIFSTPLFKEKSHFRFTALLHNIPNPYFFYWSGSFAAFPTNNDPVDPV
jgi:hypothetical protein